MINLVKHGIISTFMLILCNHKMAPLTYTTYNAYCDYRDVDLFGARREKFVLSECYIATIAVIVSA